MTDDDRLDLGAWTAPPPPADLADRVLDAVAGRTTAGAVEAPPVGRRRRAWLLGGGLAAALAAAAAVAALAPRAPTGGHGHVAATAPATVHLGDGVEAYLEAGAELTWATVASAHGTRVEVAHATGAVTYRQRGALGLAVTTSAGTLDSDRATFRVEAPVNRPVVAAASATIAAVIVVAVYEGRVSARQPDRPAVDVSAGQQVALGGDPPRHDRAVAGPVPAVTRPAVDRAQRAAVAAAIARSRAAARPAVGGAPAPAAVDPDPGLTKDEIRTGVKDVIPMISECYEAELDRDPSLTRATVTAHLTIDSAADVGTVVSAGDLDIDGPLGQSQEFRDCMGATLEAIVLPPLGDGGHVEVTYPFVFAARDDDPAATAPTPAAPAAPATHRAAPPPATHAAPDDAPALLAEASQAAVNSQYARALALSERALAAQPSPAETTKLVTIAALSACHMRDVTRAVAYFRRATPSAQLSIRQTCLRVARFDPAQM